MARLDHGVRRMEPRRQVVVVVVARRGPGGHWCRHVPIDSTFRRCFAYSDCMVLLEGIYGSRWWRGTSRLPECLGGSCEAGEELWCGSVRFPQVAADLRHLPQSPNDQRQSNPQDPKWGVYRLSAPTHLVPLGCIPRAPPQLPEGQLVHPASFRPLNYGVACTSYLGAVVRRRRECRVRPDLSSLLTRCTVPRCYPLPHSCQVSVV